MRTVLSFIVLASLFCGLFAIIPAVSDNGFDVIVLDYPPWAYSLQRSHETAEFIVIGDHYLRTISTGKNLSSFYAFHEADMDYSLISAQTFYFNDTNNVTNLYTFGVAENLPYSFARSYTGGTYIPLYIGNGLWTPNSIYWTEFLQPTTKEYYINNQKTFIDYSGFMMSAVHIDSQASVYNNIVVYYAGFISGPVNVTFSLVRTHYVNYQYIIYDNNTDVFPLYTNGFTSYSSTFKPSIHVLYNYGPQKHTNVIIVDPSTRYVYLVDVDSPTLSVSSYQIDDIFADLTSNTFDLVSQTLYVGMTYGNALPGIIYTFAFNGASTVPVPQQMALPTNYSNPKALAVDENYLFVGCNGRSEILRLTRNFTETSYQRLPPYLLNTWDAVAAIDHVYFLSYEQYSKIYRVSKEDFCPSPCPFNGYCSKGKCTCGEGFELSHDHSQCNFKQIIIYRDKYVKAHGGEIALGIFFALSFIAAVAGWGKWYLARRSQYQAV